MAPQPRRPPGPAACTGGRSSRTIRSQSAIWLPVRHRDARPAPHLRARSSSPSHSLFTGSPDVQAIAHAPFIYRQLILPGRHGHRELASGADVDLGRTADAGELAGYPSSPPLSRTVYRWFSAGAGTLAAVLVIGGVIVLA